MIWDNELDSEKRQEKHNFSFIWYISYVSEIENDKAIPVIRYALDIKASYSLSTNSLIKRVCLWIMGHSNNFSSPGFLWLNGTEQAPKIFVCMLIQLFKVIDKNIQKNIDFW